MNKKKNVTIGIIIAVAVAVIASLVIGKFSYFSLLISATLLIFTAGEIALIYFMKRHVLYRKQNIFALISIFMLALIVITAMIDVTYGTYTLPGWCVILGMILLLTGNYVLITALVAKPRHGEIEYGEKLDMPDNTLSIHGPYDVVRHPINLAAFLIAVAFPLLLGSAWAFIAAGVAVVFIITQAVTIENFRFENYKWYYDYTKKVPYMVFPVIW